MSSEFLREVSVENGLIRLFTFSPATQKRYGIINQIGFDTLTPHNTACVNLTLDQAREVVAELTEAIEKIQGEPF